MREGLKSVGGLKKGTEQVLKRQAVFMGYEGGFKKRGRSSKGIGRVFLKSRRFMGYGKGLKSVGGLQTV